MAAVQRRNSSKRNLSTSSSVPPNSLSAPSLLQQEEADPFVDETLFIECAIANAEMKNGHVEYLLKFSCGKRSWQKPMRFSELYDFNQVIKSNTGIALPFPPKKAFGNLAANFVAERQSKLQEYLTALFKHPVLKMSHFVRSYFDSEAFSDQLAGEAFRSLGMFLRSDPKWSVGDQYVHLGWRFQKSYFEAQEVESKSSRKILEWVQIKGKTFLQKELITLCLKQFSSLTHPFIAPIMTGAVQAADGNFAIVIRNLYPKGSLRDLLHRIKDPLVPFSRKYASSTRPKGLDASRIRIYGREILEGLRFLHEKNIPYGHLHTGNVLVLSDTHCQLSNIENSLLELPPFYRPFFLQLPLLNTKVLQDIYAFGLVVYEMALGAGLQAPFIESVPSSTPAASVIELLLSRSALAAPLPSLHELLSNSFFADVNVPSTADAQFKLTTRVRDALLEASTGVDRVYQEELRLIDHARKLEKAAEDYKKAEEQIRSDRLSQSKRPSRMSIDGKSEPKPILSAFPGGNQQPFHPSSTPKATPTPNTTISVPTSTSSGVRNNSSSSSQSVKPTPTPQPLQAPPQRAPEPPKQSTPPPPPPSSGGRGALLSSIQGFGKGGLKKTVTVDKSGPRFDIK